MATEEESPKPPRQIEYRPPAGGLPRVYANNLQMATTGFDVRLIFGEVVDLLTDKAIVEQNVQVTMAWAEAKILADFLLANVTAYEALNGPIQLLKNVEEIIVPETFGPLPK
jgi:hypothetical protein